MTGHSFLFVLLPHVSLLSANLQQLPMPVDQALRSAGWLLAFNLAALVLLSRWRPPAAAAATLSWFYAGVSLYLGVLALQRLAALSLPETSVAAGFFAGWAGLAAWLGRVPSGPDNRHRLFTLAGLVVIVVAAAMTAAGLRGERATWGGAVARLVADAPAPVTIPAERPDIYYIVLDGFGRPDVLERRFGVPVQAPLEGLERSGWTISRRSVTNYTQTYLSLASALNGGYLDGVAAVMKDSQDRRPLHALIQRSGPIAALRRAGYSFRMIGSNTSVTARHEQADRCDCRWPGLNEFENALLAMTPLRVLPIYGPTHGGQYQAVVGGFAALEREIRSPGPALVFAHIIVPHPPFVVDEHGRSTYKVGPVVYSDGDQYPGTEAEYRSGYQAQTRFVLDRLEVLTRLLAARSRPSVVVVHGDHGPGSRYSHVALERADMAERLPIFMAIRPAGPGGIVPDDLSPVNVLRVIFNTHFGGQYRLLPNRSYYSPWRAPYRLTTVVTR